jgi:hypothetical protein
MGEGDHLFVVSRGKGEFESLRPNMSRSRETLHTSIWCGFAASLAESLWLSVNLHKRQCGCAARGIASSCLLRGLGKPEAFRKGSGKAAPEFLWAGVNEEWLRGVNFF